MAGFYNDVLYGINIDLSGANPPTQPANIFQTDGQLIIGSTTLNTGGTHVNMGNIVSTKGSLTVGYSSPNITLDIAAGLSNTVLQGRGVGNAPTYSTATYPATTTINQILYSSSANTIGGLATANGGVLTTSSSGVPSIDTTNFAVLSTGVQMKGNNTNTAPPAGFIGEQIVSFLAQGSAVTLSNNTAKTVTSIILTAGVWSVTAVGMFTGTGTATQILTNISTTTNTITGTQGQEFTMGQVGGTAGADQALTLPSLVILVASTNTYYLVTRAIFGAGSVTAYGRISAIRVG